jgi:hypothetical protein
MTNRAPYSHAVTVDINDSSITDHDVTESDNKKLSFKAAVAPKYLSMHPNDIHDSVCN